MQQQVCDDLRCSGLHVLNDVFDEVMTLPEKVR